MEPKSSGILGILSYLMSFRHRAVGRSEISCNEIALSTELTLAKEGYREVRVVRVPPWFFTNSSSVTMFLVANTK
jgi:hypothetical protein